MPEGQEASAQALSGPVSYTSISASPQAGGMVSGYEADTGLMVPLALHVPYTS